MARHTWFQTNELKQGRWTQMENVYLRGKTLGIIGTSAIGVATARLAQAIGMKIVAWTYRPSAERSQQIGISYITNEKENVFCFTQFTWSIRYDHHTAIAAR